MKRLLTLMMVVILSIMAACSNETSDGSVSTEKADSGKPIVIQFGAALDPNNSNAIKLKETTGESWEDNRWTRLYKEKLNVETHYKLMTNGPDYDQKLRLMITSNDLPDIFTNQNGSLTDLKQLAEGGAIQELGPVYEKYASQLLKSVIEAEGKSVFDPYTFNGKLYAIPAKMPSTNGYNHLFIREDWLNNLGLKRPTTMDDVYNIAKAFTLNDPDGNKQNDTIGLTMNSYFIQPWGGMSGLFWGYGAYPEVWLKDGNGKINNGSIQPAMKEPLRLLAKMYKEGLIDKEFGTKDFNQANELAVSGKAGMFYGPHWHASYAVSSQKNDPKAKWVVVPLPSADGSNMKIPLVNSTNGGYVVKKGFEKPEILILMLNLYVETLFSEGADLSKWWTEGGIDEVWMMSPVYTLKPTLDIEAHVNMKEAIANGTTNELTGVAKGFYESIQRGSKQMELMFGPMDTPFEYVNASYPNKVMWSEWQNAPTSTQANVGSTLNELVSTSFTAIIMGAKDVDSGFDTFVKQWKELGGEQVLKEINEAKAKK